MRQIALQSALASIGRHFIGGFRTTKNAPKRGRYMPHQGERECARRRRQMAKENDPGWRSDQ